MDLSPISRTAILLLICRAIASQKYGAELNDPLSLFCLQRLESLASADDLRWIDGRKRHYGGLGSRDARAGARRGRKFDRIADDFIAHNPGCTVVNLACGFDTRFWRIKNEACTYIELDLPEVIALKKELLQDQLGYQVIGRSVLDTSWIDAVTGQGNTAFLLIAEGLFPWLPPDEAARLFQEIGARFSCSQLVLDVVPKRYTRGMWPRLVRLHSRIDMGLDVAWVFGLKHARDIEAYGKGLKVIAEEKGSAGPIITVSINPT